MNSKKQQIIACWIIAITLLLSLFSFAYVVKVGMADEKEKQLQSNNTKMLQDQIKHNMEMKEELIQLKGKYDQQSKELQNMKDTFEGLGVDFQ